MENKNIKFGFTLIELLVVISIISLLASVVIGSLNDARTKAHDINKAQIINEYKNAINLSYDKYGEYPDPGDSDFYCIGDSDGDGMCGVSNVSDENSAVNDRIREFLSPLPILEKDYYSSQFVDGFYYRCLVRNNDICSEMSIVWALKEDISCPGGDRILGTLCFYVFD